MSVWRDIGNFLFPRQCVVCGKRLTANERSICASCLLALPRTEYHLVEHNLLEKTFWKQFPIERAAAFFHYESNKIRAIIHSAKYHSNPHVGEDMAMIYADELLETQFFEGIDCIVPVPLHWRRRLKRHYNQCDYVAKGISKKTGIPIFKDVVKRVTNNVSQTKMVHTNRKQNVEGIFKLVDAEKIRGKHILLVDDVLTTGSTIASCAKELAKAENVRISVLALAVASRSPVATSENDLPRADVFGLPLLE